MKDDLISWDNGISMETTILGFYRVILGIYIYIYVSNMLRNVAEDTA